jgi:hypothetical protein
MSWNDICRAALILGVIPSFAKDEVLKLNATLKQRVAEDKIFMRKFGITKQSPTYYAAPLCQGCRLDEAQ